MNAREKCACPDPWCPEHAECPCGAKMIITDDDPAFCPECLMDRMPKGACGNERGLSGD
jgi:hypothetical protein